MHSSGRSWLQNPTMPSNLYAEGLSSQHIDTTTHKWCFSHLCLSLTQCSKNTAFNQKWRIFYQKKLLPFWQPMYFTCSHCCCVCGGGECMCVLQWTLWVSDVPWCLRGSRTEETWSNDTHTHTPTNRYMFKTKKGILNRYAASSSAQWNTGTDTAGKVCVLTDSSHQYLINVETDGRAICCQANCTAVTFYINACLQHWDQQLVDWRSNYQTKFWC